MQKIHKKSKAEKTTEGFFPVHKDDLKHSTEKIEKNKIDKREFLKGAVEISVKKSPNKIEEIAKETIEKRYHKPERKDLEKIEKISVKKSKKIIKNKSEKKYVPEKIELKKEGYELIITEKPQAALKISSALGKSIKRNIFGVPYYELEKNGKNIVVACAVGHLFTLKQNQAKTEIPVFDISWIPNYIARKKGDFTKKYYEVILKLAKKAGSITIATDYDTEGEVIGLNVVKYICGQEDANRMKFSTLTDKELNEAYDSKSNTINWGQAIAGETRHYLDWFYGINLSRALMNAIKKAGSFKIMSIGRVQGPALNLIVKKEKEILKFKSQPYWQIFITVDDGKNNLVLKYVKDIFDKKELEKFKDIKGKTGKADTQEKEQKIPPNPPFNLTTLQTEAYAFHGITPSETLRIAQSLYLSGLISYPRTSSQKLPDSINYLDILKKLSKKYKVESLIKRKKPIEGKKSDPAHPSIYPTGESQILSGNDEKIYNLIVKRFLALFCDNAIISNKTVKVNVDGLEFFAKGASIIEKGWMEIYPDKLKEHSIPSMNGNVKIITVQEEEKETQPPRRYSQASIISELEKRNLGTKATRSAILDTLYDRGYIKEKSIEATPLGISLIDTLEIHSPIIIDENLTKSFEVDMESIINSKKNFEEKEKKIIEKAKKIIIEIIFQFSRDEEEIGKELLKANEKQRLIEREENKLCICPKCKKGDLAIMYSKKNRRFFIACNAYPECKTTYSLPPNGLPKKSEKICETCGFPMIMMLRKGKMPWTLCFNKECETNKKRLEEYNSKKNEEEI